MTPASTMAVLVGALVVAPAVLPVQQPRISNGRVTTEQAGSPFVASFHSLVAAQPDIAWIGYSVPGVDGERSMCCAGGGTVWIHGDAASSTSRSCCTACRLEPADGQTSVSTRAQSAGGPVRLEGSGRLVVLFRVAERRVDRIRVFSEDCEVDAGGRPVVWLENVRPAESLSLLEGLAVPESGGRDRVSDGAISAIALHADPAADASLERLVRPTQPEAIRKKVTFWLGNARGASGLALLRGLVREDPSDEVRKSAVFGVSQSREPEAFDILADLARAGESARIRSEAVFWIAQKKDARAPGMILEVLQKDPAPEVRKKAVFALSQLEGRAGVDPLIQIARTSDDPAVRGEAIFWLGQKAGARAAAAITERIEQDPDTSVKKKAVFALSQLPAAEGVPLLIDVARTNSNPAVRRQAIFWLGQSKDRRAVDFFAELLSR